MVAETYTATNMVNALFLGGLIGFIVAIIYTEIADHIIDRIIRKKTKSGDPG